MELICKRKDEYIKELEIQMREVREFQYETENRFKNATNL
jgi:hypothetical protein